MMTPINQFNTIPSKPLIGQPGNRGNTMSCAHSLSVMAAGFALALAGAQSGATVSQGQEAKLSLVAEVDGFTQANMFNTQKYPFKYTGASSLHANQLDGLRK